MDCIIGKRSFINSRTNSRQERTEKLIQALAVAFMHLYKRSLTYTKPNTPLLHSYWHDHETNVHLILSKTNQIKSSQDEKYNITFQIFNLALYCTKKNMFLCQMLHSSSRRLQSGDRQTERWQTDRAVTDGQSGDRQTERWQTDRAVTDRLGTTNVHTHGFRSGAAWHVAVLAVDSLRDSTLKVNERSHNTLKWTILLHDLLGKKGCRWRDAVCVER